MNEGHVEEYLHAYVTGNLARELRLRVERHLGTCQHCQHERTSLEKIWNSLGEFPDAIPGEGVSTKFHDMLSAYQGSIEGKSAVPPKTFISNWIAHMRAKKIAFQIAVAVVILVIGMTIGYQLRTNEKNAGELTQLKEDVHEMRRSLAISLLHEQSASERLRGVSWSSRIEDPDPGIINALIEALKHDPNINVRLAALDALSRALDRSSVKEELIKELPRQASPLVQISLIDLMVQTHEKKAVDVLERMAEDERLNVTVKDHLTKALKELTL